VLKLHLGSAHCFLSHRGWIDHDIDLSYSKSYAKPVTYYDARERLPYDDATADLIFTSHLIEHITYPEGCHMLAECFRVLKPGGRLRVSTPDIYRLFRLLEWVGPAGQEYMDFEHRTFPNEIPRPTACFVVNNFVRAWGHLFIYDAHTLEEAMALAGFRGIDLWDCGVSECPEMCDLEPVDRLPPDMFQLETMTLEGVKT